jgi:hypothetical protein
MFKYLNNGHSTQTLKHTLKPLRYLEFKYILCVDFFEFFSFRLINSNMNVIIFIIGKALPKNEI